MSLTFRSMVSGGGTSLDAQTFTATVERVQSYVRHESGAWSGLAVAARSDPDGTTRALLALGTVLLDIAAGAFRLTPEQVLDKVAASAAELEEGDLLVLP